MTPTPQRRGRLYAIDGYACTGKTTLAEALRSRLYVETGMHPRVMQFPSTENPVGKFLREQVFTREVSINPAAMLHLFVSDAIHVEAEARKWLSEGRTVIYDRYPISSAMAYHLDQHSLQTIMDVTQPMLMVRPDLLFVLDVQASTIMERIKAKNEKPQLYETHDPDLIQMYQNRFACFYVQHAEYAIPLNGDRSTDDMVTEILKWIDTVDKQREARDAE